MIEAGGRADSILTGCIITFVGVVLCYLAQRGMDDPGEIGAAVREEAKPQSLQRVGAFLIAGGVYLCILAAW